MHLLVVERMSAGSSKVKSRIITKKKKSQFHKQETECDFFCQYGFYLDFIHAIHMPLVLFGGQAGALLEYLAEILTGRITDDAISEIRGALDPAIFFGFSDPYIGNELFNAFTCLLFEQGTEITHGKIGKAGEHRSPEPNVGIILINKFDGALDERRSVGGAALIRCESFLRSGYAPGENSA